VEGKRFTLTVGGAFFAGLLFFFPQSPAGASRIEAGLQSIWSPETILFL